MCHNMAIKYSIPVKAAKNNGALRCTIPRVIVEELEIVSGDLILWTLHDDGRLEIRIQKEG